MSPDDRHRRTLRALDRVALTLASLMAGVHLAGLARGDLSGVPMAAMYLTCVMLLAAVPHLLDE